jgi:hypothetical protein
MAQKITILVADDDPDLRETITAILAEPGYTVLTASDGYEAVRLLADNWVNLLITDVRLPGISAGPSGQGDAPTNPRHLPIGILDRAGETRRPHLQPDLGEAPADEGRSRRGCRTVGSVKGGVRVRRLRSCVRPVDAVVHGSMALMGGQGANRGSFSCHFLD